MEIKHFGNIDENKLEEYYSAEIELANSVSYEVALHFYSRAIAPERLQKVADFLGMLHDIVTSADKIVTEDLQAGEASEAVQEYRTLFQGRLEEDDLIERFGAREIPDEAFLKALKLVSIAIFPEEEQGFACLDYNAGEDLTDLVLVVCFDEDFKFSELTIES